MAGQHDDVAPGSRKKVAILGGGMAGLTTAIELTATPELRAAFDVTIYQLGWRLGGKCATGRNQNVADRIQEHGLHLWFGGYDNAFSMLGACYEELDRPPGTALRTIEDAFEPLDVGVLYDDYGGRWSTIINEMPPNVDRPGTPGPRPIIFDIVLNCVDEVTRWLHDRIGPPTSKPVETTHLVSLPKWLHAPLSAVGVELRWFGNHMESAMLHAAAVLTARHADADGSLGDDHTVIAKLLALFRGWLWEHKAKDHLDDDAVRHTFTKADTFLTIVIGILDDDLLHRGFDTVNNVEFRTWLTTHGAQAVTLDGPLVRSFYSQVFAPNLGPSVLDLDAGKVWNTVDHPGELAAGITALVAIGEYLAYRGAVLWKPTAGFAEAVVTPMYDLLLARGVTVEFFHRVDALGLAADRTTVETIAMTLQVAQASANPYDPTVPVGGIDCWPHQPLWDQLANGSTLEQEGVDFERGEVDPRTARSTTLILGQDFDIAVLAISAAALPPICREILADENNPRFTAMLANTHTVMTQAFQVWSNRTVEQLQWPYPEAVASAFTEPLDTYSDMTELRNRESWLASDDVQSIGYFCGVLFDTDDNSPAAADSRARDGALEYLGQHITTQWPGAVDPVTGGFDWSTLVDRSNAAGPARLDAQFVRANYELTERYVQTPPNSIQFRLRADESGYPNLILAGDWTQNGLNVGSVEATVMSGMLASRAISGVPAKMAREGELYRTTPGEG